MDLQPHVTMTFAIGRATQSPSLVAKAVEVCQNALADEGLEPDLVRWMVGADPIDEPVMPEGLPPGSQN